MTNHVYKRLDELDLHGGDVVMDVRGYSYAVYEAPGGKWFPNNDAEKYLNPYSSVWRVIYRADAPVQQSAEDQPAMAQTQLERMKMRLDIAMRVTLDDLRLSQSSIRSLPEARVAFADDMLTALGWSE